MPRRSYPVDTELPFDDYHDLYRLVFEAAYSLGTDYGAHGWWPGWRPDFPRIAGSMLRAARRVRHLDSFRAGFELGLQQAMRP